MSVVMGSATPSLESFARAGNKVYKLLVLSKRPRVVQCLMLKLLI